MNINLYYCNNGVGVTNHNRLIKTLLYKYNVISYDITIQNEYRKGDVGIFIQNVLHEQIDNNKTNIYLVCEEWLTEFELQFLNKFDYIFVHSNYAKELLSSYNKNVINVGFFSLDRYFFPKHTKEILHLKGKSIQKNHELVWDYKKNINIIDSNYKYLSENELVFELNNHDIHVCCSLYEAWGHYLWEAMSCGKLVICSEIPVFKEYLDPGLVKFVPTESVCEYNKDLEFLNSEKYKFRKGYFVDKIEFKKLIDNKEELFEFQQLNKDNIRYNFLDVTNKNKQKFLKTLEYII